MEEEDEGDDDDDKGVADNKKQQRVRPSWQKIWIWQIEVPKFDEAKLIIQLRAQWRG
jgi:hypothetical protein